MNIRKKRQIIKIDEDRCNGCGECVTACSEGALQIVGGKAKLVKEEFCDGFGDCIGECPTGALQIVEAEAADFDFDATLRHVEQSAGQEGVAKLMQAADRHAAPAPLAPAPKRAAHAGCPGSMMRVFGEGSGGKCASISSASSAVGSAPATVIPSELTHWPVQIHLVRPDAPFFKNRELVVMSTCAPLASADVHWRFIRGRSVVVGCPKLDRTDGYAEKLAEILSEPSIPKVIVVRMEVPCCGGLTAIVQEAARLSGRSDLAVDEAVVGLQGDCR